MNPVIRVSDQTYVCLKQWAAPWETQDETVRRVLEKAGSPPIQHKEAPQPGRDQLTSEKAWVESMNPVAREVYTKLRARLAEVGADVDVGATPNYIKFMVSGGNFAEVARRKAGVQVVIHPRGHNLAPGTTAVEEGLILRRVPTTAGWTLDVRIDVGPDTDLDAVIRALKQSYQAVRQRQLGVESRPTSHA